MASRGGQDRGDAGVRVAILASTHDVRWASRFDTHVRPRARHLSDGGEIGEVIYLPARGATVPPAVIDAIDRADVVVGLMSPSFVADVQRLADVAEHLQARVADASRRHVPMRVALCDYSHAGSVFEDRVELIGADVDLRPGFRTESYFYECAQSLFRLYDALTAERRTPGRPQRAGATGSATRRPGMPAPRTHRVRDAGLPAGDQSGHRRPPADVVRPPEPPERPGVMAPPPRPGVMASKRRPDPIATPAYQPSHPEGIRSVPLAAQEAPHREYPRQLIPRHGITMIAAPGGRRNVRSLREQLATLGVPVLSADSVDPGSLIDETLRDIVDAAAINVVLLSVDIWGDREAGVMLDRLRDTHRLEDSLLVVVGATAFWRDHELFKRMRLVADGTIISTPRDVVRAATAIGDALRAVAPPDVPGMGGHHVSL